MLNDVSCAFFEAPARRKVCVELPSEEGADKTEVGLLKKSLYGTRDASTNFQQEVCTVLESAGFRRSR